MDFESCHTCSLEAIHVVPDGRGGMIYHYRCTAEIRVLASGTVRQIKGCPDIGRVGRDQPILSDASVEKERKR